MVNHFQFVVLVCTFYIVTVFCNSDQKAEIRKLCQEKTKVSTELINSLTAENFPDDNKELKCYIACAMEQIKSMKDAKLDKEVTIQLIEKMPDNMIEPAKKALNVCADKFNDITDPCDFAWGMVMCWRKENPLFKFT